MKRVITTLALALGTFATVSSATQIQGFISGYAPSSVEEVRTENGNNTTSSLHSDFSWSLGAELLISPVNYLMVGGGLSFFSVQQDGSDNVVMPAIPIFASVGAIGPEQWIVRPYFLARVGYAFPAATFSTWWSKPLNFIVGGNIGVHLPYHMGVELNCTYLSMDKNFKADDVNFRLNSVKFGGSITVHFDLSGNSAAASNDAPFTKTVVVVETSTEPAAEDYSSYSSDNSGSTSNDDPYSAYGETSTETGSSDYGAGSSSEPAAEEVASEGSTDAAEEAAAEEVAAEAPAEEPKAEPAPEKKDAKKAPAKKKPAKKAAKKKPAKKAAKKPAKKAPAKKKK